MKRQLTIDYGDEVLAGLGISPEEFRQEAPFLLAAKLYELGRLTSGRAARLCGRGRVEFLMMLPQAGTPISNLRPEDADLEIGFGQR